MITKRNVLLVAFICSALLVFLDFAQKSVCTTGPCFDFLYDTVFPNAWIVFSALAFSIATYKMREEIFHTWIRFALWYVPLSIFLIAVSPNHGGGMLFPTQREIFGVLLPALFVLISLAIVAWKYFAARVK